MSGNGVYQLGAGWCQYRLLSPGITVISGGLPTHVTLPDANEDWSVVSDLTAEISNMVTLTASR